MKTEENELASQNIKQQEELKSLMAQLEREVFETAGSTNSRIDRTRAALEEVVRAEIQSRQSNFSNLEGRVRDIVTDCMTSLESVSKESRMGIDALVNRVNTLEVSMTSVIDGKIMVVEEAVAARQNEQQNVNSGLTKDIASIRDYEEHEHSTRVQKEVEIVERVTVVEERVEGEIDDVRQRVERARAETTDQVRAMEDAVTRRCDTTEEKVVVLKDKTEENEITIEKNMAVTNNNFDLVREDAVKSKGMIKMLKKDVGDVDDKISVNNVITTGVDLVVGGIEKEEKAKDEATMKRYFEEYVKESERKLVEKEEERERLMEQQFQDKMKQMEEEHMKGMEILQKKFREELAEEKKLEAEANKAIRRELFEAVENDRVMSVVGFVVADTVGKVVEMAKDEEIAEAGRVAKAERERLEAELKQERERATKVGEKLVKLEDIVEEREKLEKLEWDKILESSFLSGQEGGSGGGEGGGENDEIGQPNIIGADDFPSEN
ncbi:hypothetical protein TrRE_jg8752 [Triparma retinervis]|uniref:Uncharacterized protein n=1 Tax=Triparma retinervis TaxID=2557542 RepID=A0A9W7DZ48_9STRA|nr:hypothetical protein TrRE_jg8752 [Triparma retinervis]